MAELDCRFFNGYKPCAKNTVCSKQCGAYDSIDGAVLVLHLGAMGSVVRSTALLRQIKNAHPGSYIVWVTEKPSDEILKFHPAIDRLFNLGFETLLSLQAFKFSIVYALDKDLKTAGLLNNLNYDQVKGFTADPSNGSIRPADIDADELWSLGLSNEKKFFENTKSEIQLLFETSGFAFNSEKYWLHLTTQEWDQVQQRRNRWLSGGKKILIGVNTGCGNVISYKKMSVSSQKELIKKIMARWPQVQIVLLGGKDETAVNDEIAQQLPAVILSETCGGVRDGLQSIAAVDCVISGDSFGMHAGIAFDKFTLAWFGPTCAQEVDFYKNGFAIKSDFSCSPCWKRDCSKPTMCYDHADIDQILRYLTNWMQNRENDRDDLVLEL